MARASVASATTRTLISVNWREDSIELKNSECDLLDDRGFNLRPGEAIMDGFLKETAQGMMTPSSWRIAPEMTIGDVLRLFATDSLAADPLASNGRLIGMVSKADARRWTARSAWSASCHREFVAKGETQHGPESNQRHVVDRTVLDLNVAHFKRLLSTETNPVKRQTIERLLAEEEAKLVRVGAGKRNEPSSKP